MEQVRPARLALGLILISSTCTWSIAAVAQPPLPPGSEVVDPWAPPSGSVRARTDGWSAPDDDEVIDPWRGSRPVRAGDEPIIIDPWQRRRADVPTASFPPLDVIDPWAH